MNPNLKPLLLIGALALGVFLLIRTNVSSPTTSIPNESNGTNVSMVDGTQIIIIEAKGGYTPHTSTVRAGIPTVLRIDTANTYDCSSAIRLPSLGISKNLSPNGTTDIALGTLTPGTFEGTCSMGMYSFEIVAQS